MDKKTFYDIPEEDRLAIFKNVENKTGVPDFAVEKDWWVVQKLKMIFEMGIAEHLVFKGGTSLSKAWKLIDRFSEDIDLAVDRGFFEYSGGTLKETIDQITEGNQLLYFSKILSRVTGAISEERF